VKPLGPLPARLLRLGAHLTSPGGARGALLVLIYHRVLAAPDALLADEPDAARFAAELDLIAGLFNVLGFSEAVERLGRRSLPPRALAITFDDGYANNLEVAAPLLAARGLTATFFISTGFSGGGMMWNDLVIEALRVAPAEFDLGPLGLGTWPLPDVGARRRAVDSLLGRLKYLSLEERIAAAERIAERAGLPATVTPMMDERQLRALAGRGMELGAHCIRHPILSRLAPDDARREIEGSRQRLAEITGVPVRAFAYPNGRPGVDYTAEHVRMVREAGFSAAASTAWGVATSRSDPLQVPRVAPWDRSAARYALRLVRANTQRRATTV